MAPSLYDSPRLAAAYASDRPQIHGQIIAIMGRSGHIGGRVRRALDVGCGAGRSTEALAPLAASVVGLDPAPAMVAHGRATAPGAHFLAGRAEGLPFVDGAFDLIAAAGSLNYADLGRFLPDAARALAPGGTLVIYDFSEGRRMAGDRRLAAWFAAFKRRYPSPPGYALNVRRLPYRRHGLRLQRYQEFEVAAPMTLDTYLRYVMSETNVELAIARGLPEEIVRSWCRSTLAGIFGDGSRDILFTGYIASVRHGRR